ncbi:hypothetical protein [Actinoplanes sp. NPDC051494]|uniref:hypothetical protein n=1 Tax=Actinoplanes sp. NPDC051494 TaxID=3363907 RepID=UPI00378A7EFE
MDEQRVLTGHITADEIMVERHLREISSASTTGAQESDNNIRWELAVNGKRLRRVQEVISVRARLDYGYVDDQMLKPEYEGLRRDQVQTRIASRRNYRQEYQTWRLSKMRIHAWPPLNQPSTDSAIDHLEGKTDRTGRPIRRRKPLTPAMRQWAAEVSSSSLPRAATPALPEAHPAVPGSATPTAAACGVTPRNTMPLHR